MKKKQDYRKNRVVDINIYDQQEPVILETIKEKIRIHREKIWIIESLPEEQDKRQAKQAVPNRQSNITTIKEMAKRINQL